MAGLTQEVHRPVNLPPLIEQLGADRCGRYICRVCSLFAAVPIFAAATTVRHVAPTGTNYEPLGSLSAAIEPISAIRD